MAATADPAAGSDKALRSQSSPPIAKIPLEVLQRISYFLKTRDLGTLRLTCRSIEQALYQPFVREFFTIKQFMFMGDSLQALVDISKSRMSHHLKCVSFGLECFPNDMNRSLADPEKERHYREVFSDTFVMLSTGQHVDMLVEAFTNLPNLEGIIVRDLNSRRRYRDGPNAEWTSYCAPTLFSSTGFRLNAEAGGGWHMSSPRTFGNQVFSSIFYALAKGGVRIKSFENMCTFRTQIQDFAFELPRSHRPEFINVLEGLEKLYVAIDFGWRNWQGRNTHSTDSRPKLDTKLSKFLSYCTNLKALRINETECCDAHLLQFLTWLATPVKSAQSSPDPPQAEQQSSTTQQPMIGRTPPIALPRLEKLSLGCMSVPAPLLHGVIRKFAPQLKSIELHRVVLLQPRSDDDDYSAIDDLPPKIILWVDFLKRLQRTPELDLEYIKISCPKQTWTTTSDSMQVRFDGKDAMREYRGSDWKHFLKEITPGMEGMWPSIRRQEEIEEDEEDDMDEEDDGDEDHSSSNSEAENFDWGLLDDGYDGFGAIVVEIEDGGDFILD
ncbi:hypothetical protein S40285_02282 [Stachybotrys chlorohalonatus IBT 40285]|uniref:F-box domain-containing protein n=1 Tax=Stachybotrys chlorohalonatus (strain IBT 40285) TaxID=1283841 RepID=A0A084QG15_STAC4|nr:hypothetical protein S40285_02282 [Stachybotrys chlorohalonata IBT 40285]